MHVFLVFAFGDQDLQTVALAQTAHEVAAGHRVSAAEQPDGREPLVQDLACGRIDDVQEREIYSAFDPVISGVDGVAGQQEEFRAGRLELVPCSASSSPTRSHRPSRWLRSTCSKSVCASTRLELCKPPSPKRWTIRSLTIR